MESYNGGLDFKVGLDNSQLAADAAKSKALLKGIGDTAVQQGSTMENALSKASGMMGMAAMAGVASIGMLGKEILDTTAKFEKFGIVLRNTLGDAKGDNALAMIANFAATTPFQLDEVTGAFIKMANQGFVPTREEMVKLGDLASSTGKNFDMLAEAILDAQTGEFERLKEFGIKASQNGDKVTFSFKEQQTTVDKTNSSIRAYILSLGELNGIAGANAKISESLTGQMSNLGDKIAAMYNQIGTDNKGLLYSSVGTAATLIENYEVIGETIKGLIAIYGAYKVAVMFVAREQKIMAAANLLVVESNGFLVASDARAIVMAERRVVAQNAVNASMLANPTVLATMAVVGLGYAIYKLINLESDLEKSQKALNSTIQDSKQSIEAERLELDAMFGRLKAAKENTDEWKAAKDALFSKYGEQLKMLGDEATALNDIAKAHAFIAKEALKSANARGMEKATSDAAKTASDVTSVSKTNINKLLTDKFGSEKGSEIYYAKIVPVLEGEAEMTAEIQDIIKQFETTTGQFTGGQFNTQVVQTTSNALDAEFKKIEKANAQLEKTLEKAKIAFGGAEVVNSNKTKEFITAEEQRVELRKQLIVETKKLNELESKKFEVGRDKAPLEAIAAQEQIIEGIKKQLGIKEKEKGAVDELKTAQEAFEAALKSGNEAAAQSSAKRIIALEQEKKKLEEIAALEMKKAWSSQFDSTPMSEIPTIGPKPIVQVGSQKKIQGVLYEVTAIDKTGPVWKKVKAQYSDLKAFEKDMAKKGAEDQEKYDKSEAERKDKLRDDIINGARELTDEFTKQIGLSEDMAKAMSGVGNAIAAIAKGDYISAAVGIAKVVIDTAFGDPDIAQSEIIKQQIDVTNEALRLQGELLESLRGSDYYEVSEQRLKTINKELDTYNAKLKEIKVFDSRSHSSINTSKWDLTDWTNAMNNASFGGFDKEAVTAILDEIFTLKKEYKSLMDDMYQTILGFGSSTVSDSIFQGIEDGLKLGENSLGGFSQTFGELMKKALMQSVLDSINTQILEQFLPKYKEAMKDGLDETERKDLESTFAGLVKQAQIDAANVKSITDPYMTGADQRTGSSKGFAAMTQDSADEMNGRFTAIQGHTFSINEGVKILTANSGAILKHLAGIETNTGRLETMQSDMNSIKAGIDTINLKGIILKR